MKYDLDKIRQNLEKAIEDPTIPKEHRELAQEILDLLQEGKTELVYFIFYEKEGK
ncbi:hypothetical protein [Saccharolobus shibatae]|uniref:Uncharacterized protein n=1 Tax=Saccharolobus shibatae TaxID=2286 RepID=A0A8F5GVM1_9CREN|nr:hypothetical protein [Saccharolobus shibatae]QXJ30542.1 hypothetical protein J5U21_00185 [Saccharolobus shibatae]